MRLVQRSEGTGEAFTAPAGPVALRRPLLRVARRPQRLAAPRAFLMV
jgi:hypothetical protein